MIKTFLSLRKTIFALPVLISFIVFVHTSCDDNLSQLGIGILPASDTLNVRGFDTLTILAYTEESPKIRTSQPRYSPFGFYNDPIFGSTKAEFATEFGFRLTDTIQGNDPVADSIILFIDVLESRVYGDNQDEILMDIFLLNEEFPDDSLHYSDFNPDNFGSVTKIGSKNARFRDSQLKIYLDNSFADMLLEPALIENDTTYNSIDAFRSKFKGLLFRTEPTNANGAVALLNMYSYFSAGSNSVIVPSFINLYYHYTDGNSVENDLISYNFVRDGFLRDIDQRFNFYQHNYNQSDLLDNPASYEADSVVYVQSLAGTRVRLEIPGLDDWAEAGEIVVNSAILTFALEDFDKTSDFLTPPVQLGLKTKQPNGEEIIIEDLQTGSLNYFMGRFGNRSYSMNITKHVQSVIDGAENTDILIYPLTYVDDEVLLTEDYILPNRAVLTGTNNSSPIKLSIIYTKL